MFGLGMGEILLIAALVLVVVGPERLPEVMRTGGRWYAQLRRAADDLRRAFVLEADRMDADERLEKLQKRREAAMEARRKAQEESGGVAQEPRLPPTPADPPSADPPSADLRAPPPGDLRAPPPVPRAPASTEQAESAEPPPSTPPEAS